MVMFFTVTAIDNAIGGVEGTATRVLVTIGLLIVAVGYGLIQPMQSVLVADQFNEEGEDNEKRRAASFSWYYFFQNAGNLGGESVNPQLRGTVSAFSAMLSITASLVVAFVFFVVGKPFFVVRLSDREADATGKVQRINEDKPIVPWWRQAKDWVHSADAKAIWKISKVYLILTGMCVFVPLAP
jgi:dipeptide/tripeptide permease